MMRRVIVEFMGACRDDTPCRRRGRAQDTGGYMPSNGPYVGLAGGAQWLNDVSPKGGNMSGTKGASMPATKGWPRSAGGWVTDFARNSRAVTSAATSGK